jgi:Fe-S cluster biogenesis protein NfuA/nitrite reductase/ring-hydroxylating ferredoxin subunit
MTLTAHDSPPTELDDLAARVDAAVAAVQKLDPPARAAALDLKRTIEAFHKAGLTRIIQRLKADPQGKELLFELVDEPLIYALLSMHGIVRADLHTRVSRVITMVQPYMQSHGGDVEFVEVRNNVVYVRLHGACNGCSMSAVTLREGVEEALRTHVPEIVGVEVLPNEPGPALIMPSAVTVRNGNTGWLKGPALEDLPVGSKTTCTLHDTSILLINLDNRISAFRNECAHQGLPLDNGILDAETGTITCPWHGFCFDGSSGECLTAPQAQLEAFPVRVEDRHIWVRVG